MIQGAHLRVARPTDRLARAVAFYRDVLGFAELGRFTGHGGFDGVMLGHAGAGYHLELTTQPGHRAGDAPTQDHLLVFYVPDPDAWQATVDHIERQGARPVPACNPYWDRAGRTYVDPDGYRVVIQRGTWPPT